jgi:hypothetical protein
VLLWRNRRDRTRERSGRGGGSRGIYGIVGKKRTRGDRRGPANTAPPGGGGAGSGGAGSGTAGVGDSGSAEGVGNLIARSGGDDGDIVDGGNEAGVQDGKGGGRRWLPSKSIISESRTFCI